MRIVQLVPQLNQGGVERGAVELSRELVARGHESIVISAGGKLAMQIEKDGGQHITLDVCSKNPLTAALRIARLKKVIKQNQPDIVHPRSRVPAWMCFFALKGTGIALVTTVHGFNSPGFYSRVMTCGERVIYGSNAIKEYIQKHYNTDDSVLRYVPRGIDIEYFDPEKVEQDFIENFKKKYNLSGRYIITIVGRITQLKGHTDFIKAVAEIYRTNRNTVGLIVGSAAENKESYLKQLKKMISDLDCENGFVFAGSRSQVREIYALSDIIVSAASTKPETFGRISAEALAMNTPVVASAHGGTLDIMIDGQTGFLFQPGNWEDLTEKIKKAMDTNFADTREHIKDNFSLNIMVEKELEVYRELVR